MIVTTVMMIGTAVMIMMSSGCRPVCVGYEVGGVGSGWVYSVYALLLLAASLAFSFPRTLLPAGADQAAERHRVMRSLVVICVVFGSVPTSYGREN